MIIGLKTILILRKKLLIHFEIQVYRRSTATLVCTVSSTIHLLSSCKMYGSLPQCQFLTRVHISTFMCTLSIIVVRLQNIYIHGRWEPRIICRDVTKGLFNMEKSELVNSLDRWMKYIQARNIMVRILCPTEK